MRYESLCEYDTIIINEYDIHLAVDYVEPEKYLAERPAAETPDDAVLSTAYVIVFERVGDIRHFVHDFADSTAPKKKCLVLDDDDDDASDVPSAAGERRGRGEG